VKNNLQTVAALLRMQARRMTDPAAQAALQESVRRVASIAVVHETLSLALDESVDFDVIADKVLAMCAEVATTGAPVLVRRSGSFGILPAEVATPLSMTLTELVQNAVEHAYPDGRAGEIDVLVERGPERLDVDVVDDGAGLPEGFDLQASTRLGLQIVRTLVAGELGGTLALEPGQPGGTRARLSLPLTPEPTPEPEA
jgi:two-component sensor histidine kinase